MFSDCVMDWVVWRLIPGGGEIFLYQPSKGLLEQLHSAYWIFPDGKAARVCC
jgi:hypothetical protein